VRSLADVHDVSVQSMQFNAIKKCYTLPLWEGIGCGFSNPSS
jgi:hypothetical protein